jgi:hypothetical protein
VDRKNDRCALAVIRGIRSNYIARNVDCSKVNSILKACFLYSTAAQLPEVRMESVEYRERPQRWGLITAWPATRVMRGGDLGMVDIILGSWQFPVLP